MEIKGCIVYAHALHLLQELLSRLQQALSRLQDIVLLEDVLTLFYGSGFTLPEALRELPKEVEPSGIAGFLTKAKNLIQKAQRDPFYAVISYKDSKPEKS